MYSTDKENWHAVRVPSSFDTEGRVVFRRKFSIDESLIRTSSFKLVSLGIDQECEVYINDIFVGRHTGGSTTVEFDIPDEALQLGPENTIQISVVNVLNSRSTLPLRKQVWEWRSYGGLVRDTYILATPRTWISGLTVRTALDDEMKHATVAVSALVTAKSLNDSAAAMPAAGSYAITAELYDKLSRALVAQSAVQPAVVQPNRDLDVDVSFGFNGPKLWSPESPELYVVQVTLWRVEGKVRTPLDMCSRVTGFSKRALDKGTILVNGLPVVLKGVVWHEDYPGTGASMTYEQMERDILLVKSLGANAVRFAFHPPHPYLLNLCARYGLYAFVEMPLDHAPVDILSDEAYESLVESYAREMVQRDADNPAVLAWGIGDQFDSAGSRSIAFVRRMVSFLHSLDGRAVYFGSRMVENDLAAPSADIAAVDLPATDLKSFRRHLTDWKKNHPMQPVVLLSYGREVDHTNRNGRSDPLSQESQAYFFFQYYAVVRELGIAGSFVSSFSDWRGDRPIMSANVADHYLTPLGLMSYEREKRASYEMVRTLYNDEKIAAIPVGNYRASFPSAHVLSGLFVIMLVGYQYAYNRRFGEAIKRSFLRSYNFFADLRDLRAVSFFQTLILAFAVSVTLAVLVSSYLYHFRTDLFVDYVLTYLVVSDEAKGQLIAAAWHPFTGILILTGFWFVLSWVAALFIRVSAFFFRKRISFFHAYGVTVWGAMPFVLLSPVAMSLFKVMETPVYIIPCTILVAVFAFWVALRVLMGVSVIYDTSTPKAYAGGLFVLLLFVGATAMYYDSTYATRSYLPIVVHVARSMR